MIAIDMNMTASTSWSTESDTSATARPGDELGFAAQLDEAKTEETESEAKDIRLGEAAVLAALVVPFTPHEIHVPGLGLSQAPSSAGTVDGTSSGRLADLGGDAFVNSAALGALVEKGTEAEAVAVDAEVDAIPHGEITDDAADARLAHAMAFTRPPVAKSAGQSEPSKRPSMDEPAIEGARIDTKIDLRAKPATTDAAASKEPASAKKLDMRSAISTLQPRLPATAEVAATRPASAQAEARVASPAVETTAAQQQALAARPDAPRTGGPNGKRTDDVAHARERGVRKPAVTEEASQPNAATDATSRVVIDPAPTAPVEVTKSVNEPSPVKAPTPATAVAHSLGEENDGVRQAEAVGHRRALRSEAKGAVVLPDLGRFEVRATMQARDVEVHVHAEEERARALLQAHAVELGSEVRAVAPQASVYVGGSQSSSTDTARDGSHQGFQGDSRDRDHDRSGDVSPQATVKKPQVRFVL